LNKIWIIAFVEKANVTSFRRSTGYYQAALGGAGTKLADMMV